MYGWITTKDVESRTMTIMMVFKTLADAEAFLVAAGFELVPDSCDWRNDAGDDAGCCYAIEDWHYEHYAALRGFRVEINCVKDSSAV
jgi:hypothetical protein